MPVVEAETNLSDAAVRSDARRIASVPAFGSLKQGQAPWKGYGIGFLLQCGVIALISLLGMSVGARTLLQPKSETLLYPVAPPKPFKLKPLPMPRALRRLAEYQPPAPPPRVHLTAPRLQPPPKPKAVVFQTPLAKLPAVALPKPKPAVEHVHFNNSLAVRRAAPVRRLHTGMFLGAPQSRHQLNPRQVQTGGFGSPGGLRGPAGPHGNVVALGSFGLPEGPGHGNGQGGRHGAAGAVARIGFGSGLGAASGGGPAGSVRRTAFGRPMIASNSAPHAAAAGPPPARAVEILYKPHPAYTAAARARRLHGDVWLSVVFQASGNVRVLSVIQGLPGGLDQAAIAAARRIRFRPARRQGKPVDYAARIRIRFQLAS